MMELPTPAGAEFNREYSQLETRFDPDTGIVWAFMNPSPRPCFNPVILSELKAYQADIMRFRGHAKTESGAVVPVHYAVLASKLPGVFNMGGDLSLFRQLIQSQDREHLFQYAKACCDILFLNIVNYHLPMTSISLIQGDALGGGFEAALSGHVIIAEKSATMGLPEIIFNLFPGMGAYSLIARRIGMRKTEELLLSGETYSGEQMHQMGLVDVLAEDGKGVEAVHQFVKKNSRQRNGYQALQLVRDRFDPVTHEELMDITRIWVNAAMKLTDRDLKLMDRLIRAQEKRLAAETR